MAHKTGAAFSTGHIPHGCANAIYLPYVIKYNAHEPEADVYKRQRIFDSDKRGRNCYKKCERYGKGYGIYT